MEVFFLILLIFLLITALASGFPVAFALPGSALVTIGLASLAGYIFTGDVSSYFDQGDPVQWLNAAVTNFRGIYFEVERDTLIAIPLFVFMGIMLQRSKVAEDLLVAMAQLFGPVPGGLGISVVFVGALLAATTGIVGATVVAMGLISLPVMLRNNYSPALATGTISASGTLGQIIPPSIVLIILADQLSSATDRAATLRKAAFRDANGSIPMPTEFDLTSTSAGEMFLGAMMPGLVLVGLYMLYIMVLAIVKPKSAPPVPYEGKYDARFFRTVTLALVPPLTLIFVVLGSIVLGVATVNQAGAIGAIGALIMAGYRLMDNRRGAYWPAILATVSVICIAFLLQFNDINIRSTTGGANPVIIGAALSAVICLMIAVFWSGWRAYKLEDTLRWVMVETAKTTSLVFIILLGAAMLTASFRAFGGEDMVRDFLGGLPGGFVTKFIVVMAVIFVLGFFLDFIEIAVVVVPIIAPILLSDPTANITGVWLGVMIGVNMQTSFLTPPFGFALFYLRGVAPKSVKTTQIYKGVIPFIILQLIGLGIVGLYPKMVNYLPNWVNLTSETAPPPRNPRLQQCVEEYLFPYYDANADSLKATIAKARAIDFSAVPEKYQTSMRDAFANAESVFAKVAAVREADAALNAYIPEYTPLHHKVRDLQAEARRIGDKIKELKTDTRRAEDSDDAKINGRVKKMREHIASLTEQQASLLAQVPAEWKAARSSYLGLAKTEKKARMLYRRTVDEAYEPVSILNKLIADADELAALEDEIKGLRAVITSHPAEQAMEKVKDVGSSVSAVKGTSAIKSKINKARRALKGDSPNPDKALANVNKALEKFESELAWRRAAQQTVAPGLRAYDDAIKESLGLRLQERLTSDQAEEIASCRSYHRDISLDF